MGKRHFCRSRLLKAHFVYSFQAKKMHRLLKGWLLAGIFHHLPLDSFVIISNDVDARPCA